MIKRFEAVSKASEKKIADCGKTSFGEKLSTLPITFFADAKGTEKVKRKIRHVPSFAPFSGADISLQLFADGMADGEAEGADSVAGESADDGRGNDEEFSRLIKGRYKDAYTKRTQNIINRRFRETRELEEFKGRAEPLMEKLFKKHGVKSGDFDGLEARLFGFSEKNDTDGSSEGNADGKNANGENKASESALGEKTLSADASGGAVPEKAGAENGGESENAGAENGGEPSDAALASAERVRGQISDVRRRSMAEKIYFAWLGEAKDLAEYYPGFDLGSECSNPAFTALISSGVSLKEAYEAVHHRELLSGAMKYTAKKVSDALWQSVLTGAARPSENGLSSRGASLEKKSAGKLTDKDIKNILRRVEKGEKVRF